MQSASTDLKVQEILIRLPPPHKFCASDELADLRKILTDSDILSWIECSRHFKGKDLAAEGCDEKLLELENSILRDQNQKLQGMLQDKLILQKM